ncbi:MAG: hypothetical protein JF615_01810 [Asticcacaulis sp.]|nr:hypothetical protein [Asticcacaulis sp.]
MSDGAIPDEARQFLLRNIDSIAQWEGLLWLRSRADQAWPVAEIARNLYISEDETAALLEQLEKRGLVTVEDSPAYRYKPKDEDLDRIVAEVADLYRQYLIPITQLIHGGSQERAKRGVQAFANAFRIRKD